MTYFILQTTWFCHIFYTKIHFTCSFLNIFKFNVLGFFRDVDQVHDMMDDIAEQQDVAKEISEAISNPVAFGNDIDEVSYIVYSYLIIIIS